MKSANELLEALITERGAIVTSADCSEMELAFARQEGRFHVDANGMGFVLRPGRWRVKAEAALKADYADCLDPDPLLENIRQQQAREAVQSRLRLEEEDSPLCAELARAIRDRERRT